MIHTPQFYIILPNASPESWGRWVWADAEERAVILLNNTMVSSKWLVKLKKAHFSNELNKVIWQPLKTIWDSSYPVRPEMLDPRQRNYVIFHSGVKFSPHYLRRLKRECNCQTVLYLPDTLAGLNIARNKEERERYRRHYEPYTGKEDDYEPECVAGSGPDPGEGAGGNAWVRRNLPYILKNKKKYHPFCQAEINDSFHFWWTVERLWWIENGTIRYDE